MATFKDYANNLDLDVFINPTEFSDEHLINGVLINCVVDADIFDERSKKAGDRSGGVYSDTISIFVKCEKIEKPKIDEMLTVDDEDYKVVEVKENMGLYEIELTRYDY